ncbi:MAG: amidinotransferase [Mogibacterium sp.]|nr:amidinotransferase [Mogibacterium sp.]
MNKHSLQTTDKVLMVRPAVFGFNVETAVNNAFQKKGAGADIPESGLRETDAYIKLLKKNGIDVVAVTDTAEPYTPDSVFPNNWFSTHDDGTLVLYPMFAENRRMERKPAVLEAIRANFDLKRTVDLTHYEADGLFLEGTGSMVLDRVNKIVYACKSPRTNETVLEDFCCRLGYTPLVFEAFDENGMQVYHTNVVMHVGSEIAVVCMESITDPGQRAKVRESLESTGKTIVEISFDQMNHFAGNMLELHNKKGESFLIMSLTAYRSLSAEQIAFLESGMKLITPALECIEENGGGAARCMLAELF